MSLDLWPTGASFSQSLDAPSFAFKDAEWKEAKVQYRDPPKNLNKIMMSGRFATVFKVEVRGKPWAARVFTTKSEEGQNRYKEISKHVNPVGADSPFVKFEYLQEGIRNVKENGKSFPLMTMEWVQGVTMFEWVTKQCQANNTAELQAALPKWAAVMTYLKEHDIAHGDLQHGNVMFTDNNEIKLVDYDGMCVPTLQGLDAIEAGVVPYQHPSRGVDTKLDSTLDHHSSIFIYVAMAALAEAPNLWQTFVLDQEYEKLLFTEQDLESPGTSALFSALKTQAPVAHQMSLELAELYNGNIDDVPALEDFLFTWDSVYDASKNKDYRAVVAGAVEAGFREPPEDLVQAIDNAGKRIACLDAIKSQLDSADERGIAKVFDANLLGDWPEAQPLLDEINAALAIPPIYEKIHPLGKAGKWADFLLGYSEAKTKLDAYPRGLLVTELRALQQRIEFCDGVLRTLERLVKEDDPSVLELKEALDTLKAKGPHPEAPNGLLARAADLLKRAVKWKAWLGVHASSVQQQRDNALVDAWNEKVFGDWVVSSPYRDDLEQAEARLAIVKELGDLVGNDLQNVAYEQSLIEKSKMLPAGYHHSFGQRIEDAKVRLATLAVITELLVENPIHEVKLAQQWKILLKQSSTYLMANDRRKRCELAVKRAPYLVKLSQLPPKTELAKRDVALCKIWHPDLLDDCDQVAPLKPHRAAARKRLLAIAKLQAAVTAQNELAYMALAAEEVLAPYEDADFDELIQCSPPFSKLLAQTKENHRAVDTLKSAIKEGDGEKFIALYDQQLMERYKESFAEVVDVLPEFIEQEVLSKIRLKKAVIGDSLVRGHGDYKARWQWPKDGDHLRLLTKCIVGVGNAIRKIPDSPNASQLLAFETVDFKQYVAAGGKNFPKVPHWNGARVMVWGELDIAGSLYYTKHVFLGTMEHSK
jgi:hypothetical protein